MNEELESLCEEYGVSESLGKTYKEIANLFGVDLKEVFENSNDYMENYINSSECSFNDEVMSYISENYGLGEKEVKNSLRLNEEYGIDFRYLLENYNIVVFKSNSYEEFIDYILENSGEKFPSWFMPSNIGYKTIFENSDLRFQFDYVDGIGFIDKEV